MFYPSQANNAERFEKDMASVEVVRGSVKVPHVFRGLSGRCVLIQEWVEGRKLTDITSDPSTGLLRAKLVQTLLNAYMVQFLETVTLDLLVIRAVLSAAASVNPNGVDFLEQVQQGAKGFIPVLDVAAERFMEELDYGLEGMALRFSQIQTLFQAPFVTSTGH